MRESPDLREFASRQFHAAASGQAGVLRDALARESGVLVIGTDPEEWWSGYQTVQQALHIPPQDYDATAGVVESDETVAHEEGMMGWAACRGNVVFPGQAPIPLRVTLVCLRDEDAWRIVHWHVSIGVPNEDAFHQTVIIQAG